MYKSQSKALSNAIIKYKRFKDKNDELNRILAKINFLEPKKREKTIKNLKGFLPYISSNDLDEMQAAIASEGNPIAATYVLQRFSIAAIAGEIINPAVLGYVGQAIDKILKNKKNNPRIALGISKRGRKKADNELRNSNIQDYIIDALLNNVKYDVFIKEAADKFCVSKKTVEAINTKLNKLLNNQDN